MTYTFSMDSIAGGALSPKPTEQLQLQANQIPKIKINSERSEKPFLSVDDDILLAKKTADFYKTKSIAMQESILESQKIYKELRLELDQLKKENQELQAENKALKQRAAELEAEVKELKAKVEYLGKSVQTLSKNNINLQMSLIAASKLTNSRH